MSNRLARHSISHRLAPSCCSIEAALITFLQEEVRFKSAGCLHELCELFPVDWPSRNKLINRKVLSSAGDQKVKSANRIEMMKGGRFISHLCFGRRTQHWITQLLKIRRLLSPNYRRRGAKATSHLIVIIQPSAYFLSTTFDNISSLYKLVSSITNG
jgi:hypothetical protein